MSKNRALRSPTLEQYLSRLKELKVKLAVESLEHPSSKTAWGSGEASGVIQGLARAEQLLDEVLNEGEDEHE